VDPLTLASVLLLFNLYINITSQNSLQLLFCYYSFQIFLFNCNLYNSPLCGSTPVLPGYLLLRHSCTWDKTSTLWSCQFLRPYGLVALSNPCVTRRSNFFEAIWVPTSYLRCWIHASPVKVVSLVISEPPGASCTVESMCHPWKQFL